MSFFKDIGLIALQLLLVNIAVYIGAIFDNNFFAIVIMTFLATLMPFGLEKKGTSFRTIPAILTIHVLTLGVATHFLEFLHLSAIFAEVSNVDYIKGSDPLFADNVFVIIPSVVVFSAVSVGLTLAYMLASWIGIKDKLKTARHFSYIALISAASFFSMSLYEAPKVEGRTALSLHESIERVWIE